MLRRPGLGWGVALVLAAVALYLVAALFTVGQPAAAPPPHPKATPGRAAATRPPGPTVFPRVLIYGLPGGRYVIEFCDAGHNRVVFAVDGDRVALNTVREDRACR